MVKVDTYRLKECTAMLGVESLLMDGTRLPGDLLICRDDITPYWRIVRDNGKPIEHLPGGTGCAETAFAIRKVSIFSA